MSDIQSVSDTKAESNHLYWAILGVILAFLDLDAWRFHDIMFAPPMICLGLAIFHKHSRMIMCGYLLGYSWFAGKLLQFLLGSALFAQLLAQYVHGIDLRNSGSGSLGAFNLISCPEISIFEVLVVSGAEVTKGILAVCYGGAEGLAWVVVGHIFCPWTYDGHGGRGVMPFLGGSLMLAPITATIGIVLFIATILVERAGMMRVSQLAVSVSTTALVCIATLSLNVFIAMIFVCFAHLSEISQGSGGSADRENLGA